MNQEQNKICLLGSLRRIGLLSMMLSLSLMAVFAQQATIKGKVLDEFGDGAIGVNIVEKGTINGVATDVDGNYSITVSNAQNAVLQFSYIGYNTQDEAVAGRSTIDVTLAPSVVNLQEVVAIGYGTQTRRELTGSVANVTEESFNQGVQRDAASLLQGRVSGLYISTGSGDVNAETSIRLRGVSTLQDDKGPFIVIDGVPGGSLNTVAPQDIESVSVLKDASAAAIYGSRSAGGVILITTKRGQASRAVVSYSGYVAASLIANKPDLFTADEWREYARTSGQDASTYDKYGADTDWFDEITRTGFSQNHNVSLSGGTSKSNYRASVTYRNTQGIVRVNDDETYNFNFQFQQRAINDRLRIGLTGRSTYSTINHAENDLNYDNADWARRNFVLAYNMLPVYPVKLSDGSWFDTLEYDQGNPVRNQEYNTNRFTRSNFQGTGDLTFTIIEGLDIKAMLTKNITMQDLNFYNNSETEQGRNDGGFATRRSSKETIDQMEWTLDYNKMFDKSKVNVLLGYSWEEHNWSRMSAQNRNFVTDLLNADKLEGGQGLRTGDVRSWRNMSRLISFFGRVHYSYDERYIITGTIRRDGSTKFGENHKWGLFPSVAAAWGLSQENFMKDISWIDDLKLRVGYGVTGNQSQVPEYRSLELYQSSGTYYDNGQWKSAYNIGQNPNPDLKWEQTAMFNIGLDYALFNGRVNGTIEWYNKKTSDMLYNYPVPSPPFMNTSMLANVGDMSNTGIEFSINWDVLRSKDLRWNTALTLDHNSNKITRLSNEQYSTSRVFVGDAWVRGGSGNTSHVIEEGYPVGQFYGWKFLGFDADGHYIMEDVNGDGQISEDDRTYIGKAYPDLSFGWTNTLNYKQWDLSVFFRGSLGNKVLNHPRLAYAQPGYLIGSNALNDPLIYELKEVPKYSSLYVEDGSNIRLDNLSLGYTFNVRNIDWMSSARIYVTGQNMFVLSKFKGPDPEPRMTGLDPGVVSRDFYPKAHTYSIGVNIVF
ncbi:MAG: TonB-dependent receptor [Tannerella sp.]|jgi:iron complex outermembrane receptor protein|nr:TonB-dependent receptor [Tannerella sp.]